MEARKVAMSFFCETIRSRGGIPRLQLVWDGESTTTRGGSSPAFYVFNRMDSDGFVIISGDDVTMPILGYSCSNHFVVENMPPNLLDWMNYAIRLMRSGRNMLWALLIFRKLGRGHQTLLVRQ